jgi:hypothetical protein
MDRYVPPPVDSDEPLDEVEWANVDLMAAILLKKIRAEIAQAATRREGPSNDKPSGTD